MEHSAHRLSRGSNPLSPQLLKRRWEGTPRVYHPPEDYFHTPHGPILPEELAGAVEQNDG